MKKLSIVSILLIISILVIDCEKKKEDNTPALAALLLLTRSTTAGTTTGSRSQVLQVSSGRTAATSSASAARGAARTSFKMKKSKGLDKKGLMTFLRTQYMGKENPAWNKSQASFSTIPTSVTCTNASGGSCSDSSTSVVFNGSSSCTNGGTSTMTSLASTLSGTNQDALQITLTSGSVSFAACGLSPTDFANYPATTRTTITSGSVTPTGSYKLTDSSTTDGAGATTYTITTAEDLTVSGSVVIAGATVTLTGLKSTTNLTEVTKDSDTKYLKSTGVALTSAELAADTTFATVFGVSGIVVANGTLVLSGKVNGADAGANLSLSNKTINYTYLCSKSFITMTEADWSSESICTFTTK